MSAPKSSIAARATKDQVAANRTGVGHAASFADHRARMTREIVARAPAGGGGRLCLLGAGNANDVDLETLARHYAEIHLVDIDAEAVERARAAASEPVRARLVLHAPVDVSGTWALLDEWARAPGDGARLSAEVGPAVARVVGALPGPFDVVASCCMLTQLQLALLNAVTDRHPAFDALRALTNAVHVRVLAALMAAGGRALLFTDLTSDETYPFETVESDADLGKLMTDLLAAGNVIRVAHPGLLSAEIRRDPTLSRAFSVRVPLGPWLWRNGPERTFLVYGLELAPREDGRGSRPGGAGAQTPLGAAGPEARTTPRVDARPVDDAAPLADVVHIDDVIPRSFQDLIEAHTDGLAWFLPRDQPGTPAPGEGVAFFHVAYDASAPAPAASPLSTLLGPLLFIACDRARLPLTALLRVRLAMLTQRDRQVLAREPPLGLPGAHTVGIYHVNDADGDTVLYRETSVDGGPGEARGPAPFTEARRVAPKRGRMIFFDGRRQRASVHPQTSRTRVVVIFEFR